MITKKLLNSEFFANVCSTIRAWDAYLTEGDKESAFFMRERWVITESALFYITGEHFHFSRDDEFCGIYKGNGEWIYRYKR